MLVVVNGADERDLYSLFFQGYGAEVTAVPLASEAIEAIKSVRPDVLVSDLALPKKDGYSLIQEVRALERREGGYLPAVALTAHITEQDRLEAIAAGFDVHLAKPVALATLAAVVAALIDWCRAERGRLLLAPGRRRVAARVRMDTGEARRPGQAP